MNKYLLPEAISKSGLIEGTHKFSVPEDTQDYVIDNYCREPGVRSLKKYITKICEKIAYKVVENDNEQLIEVTKENLEDFIGTANYQSKKFYKVMPPGTVIGLAYNSHGGSILYIESTKASRLSEKKEGSVGTLKVTG